VLVCEQVEAYLSLALLQERLSTSFCALVSVFSFERLSFPLRDDLSTDLCLVEPALVCLVILRLVCEPAAVVTPLPLVCTPLLRSLQDAALVTGEVK